VRVESSAGISLPVVEESLGARINHLKRLEAESIYIFREAAAEFARPVMLYSIGKDSSVM
jgi:sulfate adenylyltransferase subunit 2